MFDQSLCEPSASICLATYNGARFIEQLLNSIIPHLSSSDEFIIVDDHSTDETLVIIQKIQRQHPSVRFSITINQTNQGPIKAFEKAISLANKDLVFLCDQDDIWLPHKILAYKATFLTNPNVSLVASDHLVINSSDDLISTSFIRNYLPFGRFPYIPFFNHKIHGPSIAFRQCNLSFILPFPANISSHDQWIAQVSSFLYPSIRLPFPSQAYRLHTAQVTSSGRLPFLRQLRNRLVMTLSLSSRLLSQSRIFALRRINSTCCF